MKRNEKKCFSCLFENKVLKFTLKNLDVSIILVTHDLPMALEICNRSVILNNGKITADDDTYKILKNEKIMSDNRLELPFGFALHHLEE